MDVVLYHGPYLIVIEIKYNMSVDALMEQIEIKHYLDVLKNQKIVININNVKYLVLSELLRVSKEI